MRSASAVRWLPVLALLAASPVRAQTPPPSAAPVGSGGPPSGASTPIVLSEPAIPAGQEALLADMLGKGASLPGGCSWAGASVDRTRISATYACAAGKAALELRHPSHPEGSVARTSQFVLIPREGPPSAELVEAVAALVRRRESDFRWTQVQPPPTSADRRRIWILAGLLAAAVIAAAALASLGLRYARRRAPQASAPPAPRSTAVTAGVSLGASLAIAGSIHGALRALGGAASASFGRGGGVVPAALGMIGCVLVASIAAALLSRVPARIPAWARAAAVVALYFGAGYAITFRPGPELPHFGDLTTMPASQTSKEPFQGRPQATYRTNSLGFREPEWKLEKKPGTARIALIGDSYVFGIGVDLADTLKIKLDGEFARRYPDRPIEVVSLGIPGDNIASHVSAYITAAGQILPDVVVLCLTLPNDLSRWDAQEERREARRMGLFSFARFALGDAAAAVWDSALLERGTTEEGLAHFDRELDLLARMRIASARDPRLAFFTYRVADPVIADRLGKVPGALIIAPGETTEADFIPGDGHPTGAGNAHFAAQIAAGLDADPRLRTLFRMKAVDPADAAPQPAPPR